MVRLLKKIMVGIGVLVAIPLVAAFFVKNEYAVKRDVIISKPKAEVFEYVKLLKNQGDFSKWAKMDLDMKREFRGTDGTVGFVSAWDSNIDNVGKGEQEIKNIVEGERIDYEIRFLKPMESTNKASMVFGATGESQTKVTWSFDGRMPYPANLMMLFLDLDKMIGDDIQVGLDNLKMILEK